MDSIMEFALEHYETNLRVPKETINVELANSLCYLLSRIDKQAMTEVTKFANDAISIEELHRRLLEVTK